MTTRSPTATAPSTAPRPHVPAASRARRSVAAWPLVVGLVAVSALVRVAAASGVATPWIGPDEPLYGLTGRTLWGEHTVLSGAVPFTSLLTPLLLGVPTAVIHDLPQAVVAMQVVQAIAMSSTAAMVFAWARPLAGDRWAFAAAGLSVAIPGMTYSGLMMTEALAYPLTTLALWRLARLLERPDGRSLLLLAATVALAVATRLQGIVLLPAAVAAAGAAWALTGRRDLRRVALAATGVLAAGGLVVGVATATGHAVLGVYTASVTGGYEPVAVLRDAWWHAGGLVLVTAGVPLVALGALLPLVRRRARPTMGLIALVAVASTWAVALTLQVGVFASQFVGHLAERDLLTAAPPLLVALAVWCARGGASRAWTAGVAFVVALPAALLPITRLATREAMLDGPSTVALRKVSELASEGTLRVAWPVAVAVAVALPVVLPRRHRWLAAAAAAAALLALAGVAQQDVRRASAADERWWLGSAPRSWIDDAATGPVTWVGAGTRNWNGFWKLAFWNRRLDAAVRLPGAGTPGHARAPLVSPRYDGLLLTRAGSPVATRYAVTPLGLVLAGAEVARVAPSGDLPGLSLWRTEGDARLRLWTRGLAPNGDLRGTAVVQLWGCRGGGLEVTLLGKEPTLVTFDVDGGERTSVPIGPDQVKVARLSLPTSGTRCDVTVTSPALVGTTRIDRAD